MGDLVILSDRQGQILAANDSASSCLGFTVAELQSLKLSDLCPETSLTTDGLYLTHFRGKDGSDLSIGVRVDTIDDPQMGGCLLLVARDVSAKLVMESRLLEQNSLLNNILSNIPHSIYWKDRNLVYAGCNDNFARDVGLDDPQQVIGCTVDDLPKRTEEAFIFQQCDREVMEKAFPLLDFEEQRRQTDGSSGTLLTSRVPLKDANGEVTGVLGIYSDITERRQAEAALEKSEKRHKRLSQEFQTVLNGIPDSLMLLSPDMKIIWANQGAAAHFGLKLNDFPGRPCYEIWDQKPEVCQECVAQRCFETGEASEAVRQSGDGRIWGIKAFPLKERGKVTSVIHFATDITEKKKLREEADRTGRLAALGELSAGVAHEINNPNGLVLLNLPLLEDAFADALPILDAYCEQHGEFSLAGLPYTQMREEIPRLFGELNEGALRIRQIVDDLKNFVRKAPGGTKEPFELKASIDKVIRLVRNVLNKATENFSCQVPADLPLAQGNAQQIEQVILNLLLNACHALTDRKRGIELIAGSDEKGERLFLQVKDQGRGIAAADLPHVTDPFFTTRREEGGTGLGLSIAARIVREHQGQLQFASSPGKGTTVTLTLPSVKGQSYYALKS